jgi:hypothetical protein
LAKGYSIYYIDFYDQISISDISNKQKNDAIELDEEDGNDDDLDQAEDRDDRYGADLQEKMFDDDITDEEDNNQF